MHIDKTLPTTRSRSLTSRPPYGVGSLPPLPDVLAPLMRPQESRLRFTDTSYYEVERWEPRPMTTLQAAEAEAYLSVVEDMVAPADKGRLLTRVLALLSHYRSDPNPPEVEFLIAEDWADDLAEFPAWAVDEAAREWRRSRKFKPQICEIRDACIRIAAKEMRLANKLRRLLQANQRQADPKQQEVARITSGLASKLCAAA